MSFPRYPKYKDSGIDWLGEVPEHWHLDRLKRSTSSCKNGVWGDEPQQDENDIPCVRVADFDRQRLRVELSDPTIRNIPESDRLGRVLQQRDLLLEKSGGGELQPVGCVVLYDDPRPAVCSNFVARVRVGEGMDSSFWRYFQAAAYAIRLNTRSIKQTSGIQNLDQQQYFDERATFPPSSEQTAIATFLDRETAKIDGLVAEQQRLIELLREKRQAVISHAVTKGLNPHAPMEPSGIEWLGEMPENWETRTIAKASTKITNGYVGPTRDILVESGIPYIQATHIKGGRINFDDEYFVTQEWSNSHAKSILAEGDVLIVQTGAGTGDVALVSKNEVGFNCHALIIIAPDKSLLQGTFLSAVLQSTYGQEKLSSIQTGAMHPHLNCGEVKFVEIPLPSLAEQAEIVACIRDASDRFEELIVEAQRAIDLLQERRTALISAAVTGKIDVRALVDTGAA
jgi:type I restriction enzyme S subunit